MSNVSRLLPLPILATLACASPGQGAPDYSAPYTVTTLAGTSSIGSADGTGMAARFYSPRAVATDSTGAAYIVDQGNHTIRRVTPAGVVTTFAGQPGVAGSADGVADGARFDDPHDVVSDAADNLYVTDTGNHTIRKITPAGVVTTVAGLAGVTGDQDGIGGLARFNRPLGLAIAPGGDLYVTDAGNRAIRKIAPDGAVTTVARADFPEISGGLNLDYGAIAADTGAVYSSNHVGGDTVSHHPVWGDNYTILAGNVTRHATDGTATDLWPTAYLRYFDGRISNSHVSSLTCERTGRLTAASGTRIVQHSFATNQQTVIAGDGTLGGTDGPAMNAKFGVPLDLAFDRSGTLHIADAGNNTVRKLDPAGNVTTVAGLALESATGHLDGTGAAARFASPIGLAVDQAGNVYVADEGNHCIRKISPDGAVTTLAGKPGEPGTADGMGTAARFIEPTGLAIDATGALYVTDRLAQVIRRISPTGEVSTFAGLAEQIGTQDGTGPAARFAFPRGICVDRDGNLYVVSASTVRKISPAGVTTTLAGLADEAGYVDGTGTAARFTGPYAIAVDRAGNVYVTEFTDSAHTSRLRKITPTGVVSTLAGGDSGYADGSLAAARFHTPRGIACDAQDNLYVADASNQVIRRITPSGAVSTLAGLADSPGSTDGTGLGARFYYPGGIAVGATGNLYVASGTTIRQATPASAVRITTHPASLAVREGAAATFTVAATGTPAPTFQWRRNGVAISGANGPTLNLAAVRASDAGDYTVLVSNDLGSVTSTAATLMVTSAPANPPPSNGSGRGGGGAPSWPFLALLGLASLVRILRPVGK